MCRKKKHATSFGAINHIAELVFKGKAKKEMGIYWHSECNCYHISSCPKADCLIILNKK